MSASAIWSRTYTVRRCEVERAPIKVALLLSGGVDSSLALKLLLAAGHDVTAFYLQVRSCFLGLLGIQGSCCVWQHRYVFSICPGSAAILLFNLLSLGKCAMQIWFQEDFRNSWDACPWEDDLAVCQQVTLPSALTSVHPIVPQHGIIACNPLTHTGISVPVQSALLASQVHSRTRTLESVRA